MDPYTSRKPPTGPSNSNYHLNQPKMRQHTTLEPTNEARASALKNATSSFDPSKPSFKPAETPKPFAFLDEAVAKRKANITPEQIRIQELEDEMMMYTSSNQIQLHGFVHESNERSEKLAEQAKQIKAQADKIQQQADQIREQAEKVQEKAEKAQTQASRVEGQAEQTASKVSGLQDVLRDDFRTIGSKFKAADTTISMLTARLEAIDQERSWMAAHMKMKTLAEAESHELMARRLRESVLGPDSVGQLHGGPVRLQLTADSLQQQENSAVESPPRAKEPVEVTSPIIRGEEAAEPHAETEVAEPQNQASSSEWRPHAINQLTPLSISATNDVAFTWEELHRYLGGAQYSPACI